MLACSIPNLTPSSRLQRAARATRGARVRGRCGRTPRCPQPALLWSPRWCAAWHSLLLRSYSLYVRVAARCVCALCVCMLLSACALAACSRCVTPVQAHRNAVVVLRSVPAQAVPHASVSVLRSDAFCVGVLVSCIGCEHACGAGGAS